jgi:hypothetical protein
MMITCHVDEHVPIPTSNRIPYTDVREKARAACIASQILIREGYNGADELGDETRENAGKVLRAVASGKENTLSPSLMGVLETTAGAQYVHNLLSVYDMEVVKDAKRIRNYVTNKLILETENMDARVRMKALELLGKMSDVGLFTERSEITVNNRSTQELENSLKDKLRKLMGSDSAEDATIIDMPVPEIAPINVHDALGDLGKIKAL